MEDGLVDSLIGLVGHIRYLVHILINVGMGDIKYIASNLADEETPEFIFLHKTENNSMPLEFFSTGEILRGTEKAGEYFNTITNKLSEDNRRLVVRGDVKQWNQMLAETAHKAGVTTNEDNLFHISQTEEELRKDEVDNAKTAISVHYSVGREVRTAIEKIGRTMPEDLPTLMLDE